MQYAAWAIIGTYINALFIRFLLRRLASKLLVRSALVLARKLPMPVSFWFEVVEKLPRGFYLKNSDIAQA